MKLNNLPERLSYWNAYLLGEKPIFVRRSSCFSSTIRHQTEQLIQKALKESLDAKRLFKKTAEISKESLSLFHDHIDVITKIITCIIDTKNDWEDPLLNEKFAKRSLEQIKKINDLFVAKTLTINAKDLKQFPAFKKKLRHLSPDCEELKASFALEKLRNLIPDNSAFTVLFGPSGLLSVGIVSKVCGIDSKETLYRSLVNADLKTAKDLHALFSNSHFPNNIVEIVKKQLEESKNKAKKTMSAKWQEAFQNQWEIPIREQWDIPTPSI